MPDDRYLIPLDAFVTVTEMHHIKEVQYMEKMNNRANIKKLDNDRYINLRTGEVKEFKKSDTRIDNINSLNKTFKRIRYYIANNFTGAPNELYVVLTYGRNGRRVNDLNVYYNDLKDFIARLRYQYRDISSIDYIQVVEPQSDGTWHGNLLLKFNDLKHIYIPNEFDGDNRPVNAPIFELWGHGWVNIQRIKNVDNIGAYLSAYFTDLELKNDKLDSNNKQLLNALANGMEVVEKEVQGVSKKFIKGGRLFYYPVGANIMSKSAGIKFPKRVRMRYYDFLQKIAGSVKPHYSRKIDIETDDFENTIIFEQYNLKRL